MTHPPLRVLVVDDEKMARKRLVRLLETLGGVELLAACRSAEEAIPLIDSDRVDVVFFDVEMPGVDGLEAARVAEARGVAVVFVTAHADHAVAAFGRGAVHYLLKPVGLEGLEEALHRVRARRPAQRTVDDRITLSVRGDVVLVPARTITHAVFDGELTTVHTTESSYIADESLSELARRAPGAGLRRVHRRALLSLAHTTRLRLLPSGGYLAIVEGGAEVPVSRQAARELRKELGL